MFEGSARFALHWDFVFRHVKGFDSAWQRLDWARRADDPNHSFTYSFDVYNPRRGWAVRPGLRAVRVFGTESLSTNSRGLREATEFPYERTPGARRIVLLGDSYTFGDEVSDEATYAHQLETLLPGTEILNLGVHGYGHDQMLLYLADEGVRYRPDVVLLGYVWFDMHRGLFQFNNYAKPRFTIEHGSLELHGVPVPEPAAELASEKRASRAAEVIEMMSERIRWNTGINDRRALALSNALMDSMVVLTRSIGATPVIAYLPVLTELLDTTSALSEHERALDQFCSTRRVDCVFLRPRFTEALRQGATFHTTTHWRALEHRIAAEGIRDFLVAKGLAGGQAPSRAR